MTPPDSAPQPPSSPRRYAVVAVTATAAMWMYIDRVCVSTLADTIGADLKIDRDSMSVALGAFFFAYALFQVPAGGLADRWGPRLVLALCVVGWSAATAATAFVGGFAGLLAARLALGVAEAGAYPAATGLVRNWASPTERGRFSSIVTLGGRAGGAVAPYLTGKLAVGLAGLTFVGIGTAAGEGNWRAVFLAYGVCGLVVALALWAVVRDRPDGADEPPRRAAWMPMRLLVRDRNMWLSGMAQFGTNVGWAFLVTLMPTYLKEAHAVPLEQRGWMQTVALLVGCAGMILGGLLTDAIAQRFGPRWARSTVIGSALLTAAAVCAVCPLLGSVWLVVAALSAVAFLTDLQNPSIWAFNQDVGGRYTGSAAGWGNMWGNLGAAASPIALGGVSGTWGWPAAFGVCSVAFAVGGIAGLLLDASRPLDRK